MTATANVLDRVVDNELQRGVEKGTPNRIKELRLRSRLTQEELGRIVGISESAVNRHESGDRRLDLETLRAYARAFKVPTVALFMRPDEIGDAEAPAWDEQNFTGGDDAFFRSAAGI